MQAFEATTLVRHEGFRQSRVEAGIHQQGILSIHEIRHRGPRRFQQIHGQRNMPAVEIARENRLFAFRIHDGIIDDAVQFALQHLAHPGQRIPGGPNHMGSTANGIRVLNNAALFVFMAVDQAAPIQGRSHGRRRCDLTRMVLETVGRGVKSLGAAEKNFGGQGTSSFRCRQGAIKTFDRDCANGGHHRRTIHNSQ